MRTLSSITFQRAVAVAHEVAAGDVGVDAARRADAVHGAREVRAGGDQAPRHEALADDLAGVVDVVDEVVERADALREAALDVAPFLPAEHARHEVERERAFRGSPPAAAAGLERDALLHEDRVAAAAGLDQPLGAQPPELLDERARRRPRRAVVLEQLIEERRLRAISVGRRCPHPRAHLEILPRLKGDRFRRMEKPLRGPVFTCHTCPGSRPGARTRSTRPATVLREVLTSRFLGVALAVAGDPDAIQPVEEVDSQAGADDARAPL